MYLHLKKIHIYTIDILYIFSNNHEKQNKNIKGKLERERGIFKEKNNKV